MIGCEFVVFAPVCYWFTQACLVVLGLGQFYSRVISAGRLLLSAKSRIDLWLRRPFVTGGAGDSDHSGPV